MAYNFEKVDVQVRNDLDKTEQKSLQTFDVLFDDDIISTKYPRKLGNCNAYLYRKGEPYFTVGPDCIHTQQGLSMPSSCQSSESYTHYSLYSLPPRLLPLYTIWAI